MCITVYITMVEVSPSGFLTSTVDAFENHLGLNLRSSECSCPWILFPITEHLIVFPFVIPGTHGEYVALVVKERSSHSSPSLF